MENTNFILAVNIQKYRRKTGLTQEELAEKLGVTFQAVSKWENAKSAPDIFFLPKMADLFGCYIDELFSRDVTNEAHHDHCPEFPWADLSAVQPAVGSRQSGCDLALRPAGSCSFKVDFLSG